jgi:hypothetical protein
MIPVRFLLWHDRILYYVDGETGSIRRYDDDQQRTDTVAENAESHQALGSRIIAYSRPRESDVHFLHVSTGQTATLRVDASSRVPFRFLPSPDGRRILGTLFADREGAGSRAFFIFDLESSETRLFEIPGTSPDRAEIRGWIDEDTFWARVPAGDGHSFELYIIDAQNGEIKRGWKP